MSDWNLEIPTYKAKRNGEVEQRPATGGKRKPRKWKVMSVFCGKEYVAHHAASKEACEAWIEKQRRSYYGVRLNKSPAAHDAAKKRAEERAARYRIVGPPPVESQPEREDK